MPVRKISETEEIVTFTSLFHPEDRSRDFSVRRYLQNPYEAMGPCETCGKMRYAVHYNVTIHPQSYVEHIPLDACWREDDEECKVPLEAERTQ